MPFILTALEAGVCQITGAELDLTSTTNSKYKLVRMAPRVLNTDCGVWEESNTLIVAWWVADAYAALEAGSVTEFKQMLLEIAKS